MVSSKPKALAQRPTKPSKAPAKQKKQKQPTPKKSTSKKKAPGTWHSTELHAPLPAPSKSQSTFKVIFVGDGGVGKTTFLKRHRTGEFEQRYIPTMGVEVHSLEFLTTLGPVVFRCWDTAGQEKFGGLRDGYYIGADAAVVFAAVDNPTSRKRSQTWLRDVRRVCPTIPVLMCGNKSDLVLDPDAAALNAQHEGQDDSQDIDVLPYFDISVKTNSNTSRPWLYLIKRLTSSDAALVEAPALLPATGGFAFSDAALVEAPALLPATGGFAFGRISGSSVGALCADSKAFGSSAEDLRVPLEELSWTHKDDAHSFCKLSSDSFDRKGCQRILAFDMDFTLVEPKSGRTFSQGRRDWQWWHPSVVQRLRAESKMFDKIVIFTNQAGFEKKKVVPKDIEGKILDIVKELGLPVQAFIAGATDHHRKPFTTMWDHMVQHCNGGVQPVLDQCRYVGDAAGRDANWKPGIKRDFGCGDRKFAANIGIPFSTPDAFFKKELETTRWLWRSPDPQTFLRCSATAAAVGPFASESQELVLFVGLPASGKSTFAQTHFIPHGYQWINRDTLLTKKKCLIACVRALQKGCSVVIDNTSPSEADRLPYIEAAQQQGIPVRAFHFRTSPELAEHLNNVRTVQTQGQRRRVPAIAYRMYNSKFQCPSTQEGIAQVHVVNFEPHFATKADAALFMQWTES